MTNQQQNIDQDEISKFASLAAHWWDENGDLKTLHQLNPLRLEYISKKINLTGKSVLDIGCGGGILCEGMAVSGANVTGLDMNKAAIDVARLHLLESGLKVDYQLCTAESMAEKHPGQYDVITCLEMLEHVPDPASIVKACMQMLKPGGHLFFSTINRTIKAYLFAVIGAEYIMKLLPRHTHDYAKFIRPAELSRWIRDNHGEVKEITGVHYQPFSQQFSLSDDVSINYLLYAVKPL